MRSFRPLLHLFSVWFLLALLVPLLAGAGAPAPIAMPPVGEAGQARSAAAYGRLPLTVEHNQGQAAPGVRFLARGAGYGLALTRTGAILALHKSTPRARSLDRSRPTAKGTDARLALRFLGANPHVRLVGDQPLPGRVNYLLGNDPSKWLTGLRTFGEVRYRNLYRGIDARFYRDHGFGIAVDAAGNAYLTGSTRSEDFPITPGAFDTSPYGGFVTKLAAAAITVLVDIKPGSDTNPINLRSQGVIPVAILSTASFDSTSFDSASVCFGDAEDASQRDCTEAHGTGHLEYVNGDGRLDLLLHFESEQTKIDPGDTQACLTGTTATTSNVEGCDSITTL
jgi:hypothetical protein